ncbi:MAG: ParB/RepB/Spo0J family partition protein, partial [Clostridia bacterium]|nr:ParB/RepB/Spo0J family partition protein [Clostridia bacterium]
MATGRKSDFTLPTLDDLFSSQAERDEAKLAKIKNIPLTEIDDFPNHPFKVRDDEDMVQLIDSIKERGVITPAMVRQKDDGRYEIISGHRRKRACELAGLETLRCEVVDLTKEEATILMVESNFQRSQILPSEKAFAYKMRNDALKKQGERTDLTSSPVGIKLVGKQSLDLISEECGDSRNQIHRYIRLTNLVPELLEFVDEGRIKMRPAVELSYLDEDCQRDVVEEIDM